MSATTRSRKTSHTDDYPTPAWVTAAIAPLVPRGPVLDPCAGLGSILDVLCVQRVTLETYGFEIDPNRAERARNKGHSVHTCDALTVEWPYGESIVMNPPFSRAEDFVFRAVANARGRPVFALLRVGWLEAARRAAWNLANPCDVYVLSPRPRFINGRSDACTYAWFVWGVTEGGHIHLLHGGDSAKGAQNAKRFACVDRRRDGDPRPAP